MKLLSGIIGAIAVFEAGGFKKLILTEAFFASHVRLLPTTAIAPRGIAVGKSNPRGHAKTVAVKSASRGEIAEADTEAKLVQKANDGGGHCGFGEFLSCFPMAAAGWLLSRRGSPSSAIARFPLAVQAATASAVLLVAATTDEDIMSAMRGLDDSPPGSSIPSQGKPEVTLNIPSIPNGETKGLPQNGVVSSGDARTGNGGGGVFQSGGVLELRGDSELMRSLAGGPRQAGPLTHGF